MKARFSYPLAFLLPCAMLASIAAVVSVGVGAGVAWLFIHGDNPWPDSAERIILALALGIAIASFATLVSASYFYGRRQESLGGLGKWHVIAAAAVTLLLPALVLLRQHTIGALGS